MSMTGLQRNWSAVGFTPTSGTLQSITKVDDVQIDPGGKLKSYSGDTDLFVTTIVTDVANPKVTVKSSNVGVIQGLTPGTVGVFTATLKDAKGVVGGDIVYTVSNAVVENTPGGGKHADFADATATFMAFSSDGTTNPIAFTRS